MSVTEESGTVCEYFAYISAVISPFSALKPPESIPGTSFMLYAASAAEMLPESSSE